MSKKILVTGGAGFIGSHLADKLIEEGHSVRILDNLDRQVHGKGSKKPEWVNPKAEFIKGDVKNKNDLRNALKDIEIVFHEAATVGVGQSMYELNYYVENNNVGTSNLLETIVKEENRVKKIIVAASMSSYGEGLYKDSEGNIVEPDLRNESQMKKKKWELIDKKGNNLIPMPTPETKTQKCNSIYALTKKDQEEMFLMIGKTYGLPSVALRYFNVFGPRQSLSNPYTGVVAIFTSRIKNNKPPIIYEDGNQSRDFISVHDIVKANILAMNSKNADYEAFNVGTGKPITIKEVSEKIAEVEKKKIKPKIQNTCRKGDVRHCYADITKIREKLDFKPDISFKEGLEEISKWAKNAKAEDKTEKALKELKEKGLV